MGTDVDIKSGTGKRKRGRPKGSKSGYTMSEKAIVARKKGLDKNHAVYLPAETEEEMSYNARQIEHIMRIHEIAQNANSKDLASLKSCFLNYLKLCQSDGFKVGNMAACAAMGITAQVLNNWAIRDTRPDYKAFAQFVKTTCSLSRETLIADQKINPVIGIFWQRNFDGLRNDTEQQQLLQEQETDEQLTADEYRKKYGKLLEE